MTPKACEVCGLYTGLGFLGLKGEYGEYAGRMAPSNLVMPRELVVLKHTITRLM